MKCCWLVALVIALAPVVARADTDAGCPDKGEILEHGKCVKPQAIQNPLVAQYESGLRELLKDAKRAAELFDRGCKARHAASCTQLGFMYQFSRGRVYRKDLAKAGELFERGCELGDAPGCQERGMIAVLSSKGGKDEPQLVIARKFFERACARDRPYACTFLGQLLSHGMGGPTDAKRADALFAKAHVAYLKLCPLDDKPHARDGEVCWQYGYVLREAWGEKKDEDAGTKAERLSCDANFGPGCAQYIAHTREKTKQPASEFVDLYRKACHLDVAEACGTAAVTIGNADRGKSTEPADLARRGCDLETKECGVLAEFYRLGWSGLAKDEAKATEIYRSACDAGDQGWCMTYAKRLHAGTGVTADVARAIQLLEAACTADTDGACEQLARWLTADSKNKDNDERAFELRHRACARGSADGCFLEAWAIRYNRRGPNKILPEPETGKQSLALFEGACAKQIELACYNAGLIYRRGIGVDKDPAKAYASFRASCFTTDPSSTVIDACRELAALLRTAEHKPDAKDGDANQLALRATARGCRWTSEWSDCSALYVNGKALTEPTDIATVVGELDAACGTSDYRAYGCYWSALVRLEGKSDDRRAGFERMTKLCSDKDVNGCFGMALAYSNGRGTPVDLDKAAAAFTNLCNDRIANACAQLADLSVKKKDYETAFGFASKACEYGNGDSCNFVGFSYYAGRGVVRDTKQALGFYKQGCDKSSSAACADLAEHLRYGIGTPIDLPGAVAKYKQACEMGSQYGCAGYAHFLATGTGGVAKDVKKAIALEREACSTGGAPEACLEVVPLLEETHGATPYEISKLRDAGEHYARKYAETNPEYVYWLGVFYREGFGVPKSDKLAREQFAKACEGYDPLGCMAAGKVYGASTAPGDRDLALSFYDRACGGDVAGACEAKAELAKLPAPTPAVVHAKGCGGCTGAPGSGGLAIAALALMLARRRRPDRRGACARSRACPPPRRARSPSRGRTGAC